MPIDRPAGLPRAPAGAVAVLALVVAAPMLDGGLLVPASTAAGGLLRGAGLLVAGSGLALLLRRRDVGARGTPGVLAVAAAVGGTIALLTLPVSDVVLDWPPPADPEPLAPTDPAAGGALPGPGTLDPPVLRLPAGGRLDVHVDELYLELPDGSSFSLGPTDGDGTAAALPPGPLLQIEVGPDGGMTLVDGAGNPVADLPADGAGLDLGDVRVEGAGGNGLVDVHEGAVTDAGGATPGEVEVLPDEPDRATQDAAATVAGVLLAAAAYWLVFLHGRTTPRRRRDAAQPAELIRPDASADPVAAGAGLVATLEGLLADADPRTGIVAAYARLLAALDDAGYGRRPPEAPHEHLRRVLQPLGVQPAPVHDLAELFVLARFGVAAVTEAHRTAAIGALRQAVDDLTLGPAPVPA